MNERIKSIAIECAGQLEWDGPTPESYTFTPDEVTRFANFIVYDILSELTNDDSLGSSRIEAIRRLAERYGVANNE
jgi:hypothetical protein